MNDEARIARAVILSEVEGSRGITLKFSLETTVCRASVADAALGWRFIETPYKRIELD